MSKENEVTVDVSVGRRDDREDLGEAAFNLNASLGLPAAVEEGKEEEYSNGEGADKEGKEEDSAAEGADKVAAIPIVEEDGFAPCDFLANVVLVVLIVCWLGDVFQIMQNLVWVVIFWIVWYMLL